MDLAPGSPYASAARPRGPRLHRRRALVLLRWGVLAPLAVGFGLVAVNGLLAANGIDRIAVRDLARLFIAVPSALLFALGWAYLSSL